MRTRWSSVSPFHTISLFPGATLGMDKRPAFTRITPDIPWQMGISKGIVYLKNFLLVQIMSFSLLAVKIIFVFMNSFTTNKIKPYGVGFCQIQEGNGNSR